MMNERFLFPSEPSAYHLDTVTIIRLEGPDAVKYLNGQVTCDVAALKVGDSTLGAHCNPKGKVIAVFRLFKREDDLLLLYKKELTDIQLAELKKYAVFSKLTVTNVSDAFEVIGIAGAGSDDWLSANASTLSHIDTDGAKCKISDNRWLMVTPKTSMANLALPIQSSANWWGLDILDGLPQLNKLVQTEFIPQALNLQALSAISFTKGCYTGQEIVARAKYRGTNNRSLFILKGVADKSADFTSPLERQIGENWRTTGTILDIWQEKDQLLMSVVLPADTAIDSKFRLANDVNSSLSIQPLPYSIE
jgi:folate-binding protein YgfZ